MAYSDFTEEQKEKAREAAKLWNKQNKERRRENKRRWAAENKDKISDQNRRQYERSSSAMTRERRMFYSSIARAQRKGIEYSLTMEDLVIPHECPVFNKPFEDSGEYIPSIDRIDPNKGYIINNIAIISLRANRIKNDGTAEEHRQIAQWLDDVMDQPS